MNFKDYVKQKRKEKNLSLRELSKISGISHSYLSQLETGKRNIPTIYILKKLSKGLDEPLINLLTQASK